MTYDLGAFDDLMIDTVTIQKQEMSAASSIRLYYTNVNTGVPARIEPTSADRANTIMGKFPTATHRMFIKATYDVKANYRIIKGSTIYEVRGVENFFDHHLEVALQQKDVTTAGA